MTTNSPLNDDGKITRNSFAHNTPMPHLIKKLSSAPTVPSWGAHVTKYSNPYPSVQLSQLFPVSPGKQGTKIHFEHDSDVFIISTFKGTVVDGRSMVWKGG